MEDKITKEKLEKYKTLTKKALEKAKRSIIKGKEQYAKEIIEMVSNYLSDAEHFEKKEISLMPLLQLTTLMAGLIRELD